MAQPFLSGLVKMECRAHRVTGAARDDQIFTWFVGTDELTSADCMTASEDAWGILRNAIDDKMTSELFPDTATFTNYYFDMFQPEPRVPIGVFVHGATLGSGAALPEECSMVVSIHAEPLAGQNQARRRGRFYLPTFAASTVGVVGGYVTWDSGVIVDVTTAMSNVKTSLETADCAMAVFSRAEFADTPDDLPHKLRAATTYINGGWVDDEPDTQRRRGRHGGTKSAWS